MDVLFILNDNLLKIKGAKQKTNGAYINAGTATVTLKDSSGENVVGQLWPANLTYVAGSNGDWIAVLEDTLELVEDEKYTAIVDMIADSGLKAHWKIELPALSRVE